MDRVYIIQESPGKNVLGASSYGRLETLLRADRQITVASSVESVIYELRGRLADFDDGDYLVLIGDPVLIGLVFALAAAVNSGRVKVLKWDKQLSRYYLVQIDIYSENKKP